MVMNDQDETALDRFTNELRKLELAHRQLATFQEKSREAIRDDRLSDAEYFIAWIDKLEVQIPEIRRKLNTAFAGLNVDVQQDVVSMALVFRRKNHS